MGVFVRQCVISGFELNTDGMPFFFRFRFFVVVSGAGTLAFAIRSGVNLILLLARIQRARNVSTRSVRPVVGCLLERHELS